MGGGVQLVQLGLIGDCRSLGTKIEQHGGRLRIAEHSPDVTIHALISG
jgi:hypothetical protein